ncbi:calpain-8-like [Gigantopelta aegis]|uniref:calpain-8-like n=1 Tax=Gigantopelta aegis TaxID=1735272 RepID=UPI001B88924D|nr:calpain-8-like [Gigantopelta aegis]
MPECIQSNYILCQYDYALQDVRLVTPDNSGMRYGSDLRLSGSYSAIYGGEPGDAYLALTGGVAERVDFQKQKPEDLDIFINIRNSLRKGGFVSCFLSYKYNKHQGLVGNQYYTVNDAGVVFGRDNLREVPLLKVGNLWVHPRWTGAWSARSKEWNYVEQVLKEPDGRKGEFWVCLRDFLTYFSHITICAVTPDNLDITIDPLKYVTNINGEWLGKKSGGFHNRMKNPRFQFTVPEDTTGNCLYGEIPLVVQIIQRTRHQKNDRFIITCDLYKVIGKIPEAITVEHLGDETTVYVNAVQMTFRYQIDPGEYVVIPSTKHEKQEKEFLLRIFTPYALKDIKEMGDDIQFRSCAQVKYLDYKLTKLQLPYIKCLFGNWVVGVNDGGRIFYQNSFPINPQFSISIRDRDRPVVFHLLQDPCAGYTHAVGIRLFPLKGKAPIGLTYVHRYHEECVKTIDGVTSRCMVSNDVDAKYVLRPGNYVAVIFMEKPGLESSYSLVVRSNTDIDVRDYQAYA